MVTIREFAPGDEEAFYTLNETWIKQFFAMEPKDEYSLRNPQQAIVDPGGRIFFACLGATGEPVGCCALMAMAAPGEFEVVKMAVRPSNQGGGIGRKLLTHVLAAADAAQVRRLYLETNHVLTPAIKLYQSLGFRQLRPEAIVPWPYARADVYMERLAQHV